MIDLTSNIPTLSYFYNIKTKDINRFCQKYLHLRSFWPGLLFCFRPLVSQLAHSILNYWQTVAITTGGKYWLRDRLWQTQRLNVSLMKFPQAGPGMMINIASIQIYQMFISLLLNVPLRHFYLGISTISIRECFATFSFSAHIWFLN